MHVPQAFQRLAMKAARVREGLRREREISDKLHGEAEATVRALERADPGLRERLRKAHAFAVFPTVGRASAVLGGSYGLGEVFREGRLAGYAGIVQLTLGVQLGGQTFTELVIFDDEAAFAQFRQGRLQFASNASAVAVKAGVAVTRSGSGTEVRLYSRGGFQLEAAIGGQKFIFKSAALTRGRKLAHADEPERSEGAEEHPPH